MQAKRFPDVHARLEYLSKMALQFVLAFVFPTGEENQNSFTSQEEESDKNRSKHVPLALPSRPLCTFAFSTSTLYCFPWTLFGHVL